MYVTPYTRCVSIELYVLNYSIFNIHTQRQALQDFGVDSDLPTSLPAEELFAKPKEKPKKTTRQT